MTHNRPEKAPPPPGEPVVGRVACIGAGAMGEALVAGMLRAGLVRADDVRLSDADEGRVARAAAKLGVRGAGNAEAARGADVVIVAVKPEHVPDVLGDVSPAAAEGALIASVAAGVSIATLLRHLPPKAAVVRVMPNTPALIGAGATALAPGPGVEAEKIDLVRRLFAAVGTVHVVSEGVMDAVTGLSGSGPAYVYMFIEALADGGVLAGLPRETALQLAAKTVAGAAEMVLQTGRHPGELKDMVASPGGTTIAGVATLEDRGLRAAVMRAVAAAAARSEALGREQEDSPR